MDAKLLPNRDGTSRHPDWEKIYAENPFQVLPWHCNDLDPDLIRELSRKRIIGGSVLDVGAGVGTHSSKLAKMGFEVTATDLSASAVQTGKSLYSQVKFFQDDITQSQLSGPFDYIFDRGCLHCLPIAQHDAYARNIAGLVRRGGLVFLKCLSSLEPKRDFGPLRFSLAALLQIFESRFRILRVAQTEFQGNSPYRPKALFLSMTLK